MTGPVVILGTGRSGSSLVGQLFERHMPYRFEPRMHTLRPPPAERQCWKLPWDDDPARRTPGCRVDVEELAGLGASVLWLVRHPLDYACSAVPMWEDRPGQEAAGTGGGAWLLEQDPLVGATVGWLKANYRGLQECRLAVPTAVVRYEDVVERPGIMGRRMLEATEVPVVGAELAAWSRTVGNGKMRMDEDPRQANLWYRQDHDVRVGRWRENLPEGAAEALWELVSPLAELLGYDA